MIVGDADETGHEVRVGSVHLCLHVLFKTVFSLFRSYSLVSLGISVC